MPFQISSEQITKLPSHDKCHDDQHYHSGLCIECRKGYCCGGNRSGCSCPGGCDC